MLQHLELVQGADARFDLPVLIDGAPPSDGIAGWTFAFRLFAARDDADSDALLTLTTENSAITLFNLTDSIARITLTKEQLSTLSLGRYFWRVSSLAPNGDDDIPAHGWLTLTR